ncbi:MAG: type II toxin-antitoxin system ParD family antitoxin [Acetobacteraceae bacterium]|nr:type II toxin-antitoxin system ParD family antitoxin [Acetobacteraceae bacterium]
MAIISKNFAISILVDRTVAEGRCGFASDTVSADLCLFEGHETRRAACRAALIDGERSGPWEPSHVVPSWNKKALNSRDDRLRLSLFSDHAGGAHSKTTLSA